LKTKWENRTRLKEIRNKKRKGDEKNASKRELASPRKLPTPNKGPTVEKSLSRQPGRPDNKRQCKYQ
jgi:hypothetical protein